MNLRHVFCVGFASQCLVGAALAQPALDRVEQQLRKQTTPRVANAAAATDDAAPPENQNAGYLGILGDDRKENGKGVRVTRTDAGGPAAKAGIKIGDLITAIDELPIKGMDDMGEMMSTRHAGGMVKFSLERDGQTRDVSVRLERRPPPDKRLLPQFGTQAEDMPAPGAPALGGPAPGPPGPADSESVILRTRRPKLGVITVNLSAFMREQARLPGSYVAGVFVTYVDPDAPAGKAGLPVNAIITSVDGEPIDSPETLKALVDRTGPGQQLNITYYSNDHESRARVILAGGPAQPPAVGPQATVRAKPVPRTTQPPAASPPPAQLPDFEPDLDDADAAAKSAPDPSPPDAAPPGAAAPDIAALERRIAELEKRVAELEAAAAASGDAEKK